MNGEVSSESFRASPRKGLCCIASATLECNHLRTRFDSTLHSLSHLTMIIMVMDHVTKIFNLIGVQQSGYHF